MKAHEATGLGILAVRDPWEKLAVRDRFGAMVFGAIDVNSLVTPDSSEGTQYVKVKHPNGVILCAAIEQNPNNLNKQNILLVPQGDWISYVKGVLGAVSGKYFDLKYPGFAKPAANTAQSYVPLNSTSLNNAPPSISQVGYMPAGDIGLAPPVPEPDPDPLVY